MSTKAIDVEEVESKATEAGSTAAESAVKPKSKRRKKELITYETYIKMLILVIGLFLVSRVSVFGSIYPFGTSFLLAIIICDRRNILFLPIGLIGVYSATMNAYLAGADMCSMTISAAVCYFLGRNGFLINGTQVRMRKNREQALLILALFAAITKLMYHMIMDVILTYDLIMAIIGSGVLLTVTFVFLYLYHMYIEEQTLAFSFQIRETIDGLWWHKRYLLTGMALGVALILFCVGALNIEIMKGQTVYALGAVLLLNIGFWIGSSRTGDRSEELAERIKTSLQKYSDIFEKLQRTYGRAVERKSPVDEESKSMIVQGAKKAVCKTCSLHGDCWEIYAGRAKRYILESAKRCENKTGTELGHIDEKYGFTCQSRSMMSLYIKEAVRFSMEEYKWQKKIENSREAMAMQFRGVTRSIYKIILELEEGQSDHAKIIKPIDVETGVCCSSKTGGISGDSHICTPLSPKQYMVAISDGMGSGEKAAAESLLTVNMLYDFMRAGFDVELALNAMNTMLLIKSPEEIFSTVDMAIVDLEKSRMRFYKIGAAMAFIKRDTAVTVIKQAALPMGIIDRIQIENIDLKVIKGDMIIMVSDGITEADREDMEGKWLETAIRKIGSKNPQTVADLITKEASDRYGQRERDDMTVIVIAVR